MLGSSKDENEHYITIVVIVHQSYLNESTLSTLNEGESYI